MAAELTARQPGNPWRRLRAGLSRRVSSWVRRRQGSESLPLSLRAKRLYILPTSIGVTFAIVAFAMLLGSMNYNNSMGFALTFLLAATGLIAMHRCHQNLSGLRVEQITTQRAFAGQSLPVSLVVKHNGAGERLDIRAVLGQRRSQPIDVDNARPQTLSLSIPTDQRGPLSLPRVGLNTTFPLGLLYCWAWIYVDQEALIWPAPASDAPQRPLSHSDEDGERGGSGEEDFAGLRDYQRGDSSKRVAWKTFARSGQLKSRQFEGGSVSTSWIDLDSVPSGDIEYRLSGLCRWILDADAAGDHYGLRLPGLEIDPGVGRAHRDQCLDALARIPHSNPVTA